MKEPIRVIAQISPDQVVEGFYVVNAGVLTMVGNGPDGQPIDEKFRLRPGDNPDAIAKVLTKRIRKRLRGELVEGFDRPLTYSSAGIV